EGAAVGLPAVVEAQLVAAGEKVEFSYASEQPTPLKPSSYQWIRLEDRATDSGPVADGRFALTFERPGTYSVELRDAKELALVVA
ncbi:PKD domain-containing protein, partial [Escherichia coli]